MNFRTGTSDQYSFFRRIGHRLRTLALESAELVFGSLRRPLSRRARRWTTLFAAGLFLLITIAAVRALDSFTLELPWLFLAVLISPLYQVGNALEYQLMGRMVGETIGLRVALQISIAASAANLLPVPGAAMVRIRELAAQSGRLRPTVLATAVVAVAWLGAASLIAAAGLVILRNVLPALSFAALGIGAFLLTPVIYPRDVVRPGRVIVALTGIELLMSLISALRICLVMAGIGLVASPPRAMVLAASGPLGAMLGFFPGGLGIRELIGGLLAPLALASPQVGIATIGFDRVTGLISMIVLAVAAYLWTESR
jgi:hypothetical protein